MNIWSYSINQYSELNPQNEQIIFLLIESDIQRLY
jgi:hypothetical protein